MTTTSTDLAAENARLREELASLRAAYEALETATSARIQKLIDENELLADANRLLEENAEAFARHRQATASSSAEPSLLAIPDELLLPGGGITTTEAAVLEDVHAAGNLLSVATPGAFPNVAVTGGVDKTIAVHDWRTQRRRLCVHEVSAPVLDLAVNPRCGAYFAASLMDARHGLFRLVDADGAWRIEEVAAFQDHTRPGAMRVAWSSCGTLLATGSSDKSINIYQCKHLEDDAGEPPVCEKIKSFYFNGTVEALTFVPPSASAADAEGASGSELLVIAVRDDCYVHYVDCQTFEKERINMNPDGIEHVSYTIMDLRTSPQGKYLLAATDKDRHFVFAVKSNVILRNFYGHKAGPYSQPRVLWHPSEKYVISNTEDSGAIFVWCVASERVHEKIDGHDKLIRAITCSAVNNHEPVLLTVSYDKRLKAWTSVAVKC